MGKLNKQPIRDFMQKHYTEQHLASLLAHCRDGKFSFFSCCCFIGVPTADHALMGQCSLGGVQHYSDAHRIAGACEAERALRSWIDRFALPQIGAEEFKPAFDVSVRRILIPVIRAEMWRRAKLRTVTMAAELNQPASPIQSIQESVLEQDVAK